jgi:hypothetical protein
MRGLCHNKKSEPESFADKLDIELEINRPIAPANDNTQLWQMPTTINLNSSRLSHATTMTNQNAHLHLASPQSFTSTHVPFSTICPLWWIVMYCSISCSKSSRYFIKKLPAGLGLCSANSILSASLNSCSTSITNLSASLGLKTANQNSNKLFLLIVEYFSPFASSWDSCWSAKLETKAITEMIATTSKSNNALPFGGKSNKSFDNKSSSTFQLVVASVDWISNVMSACAKCPSSHESNCNSLLAAHAKCLNSHESSCASQIVARANCLNKSNVFAFRLLIVGFIQQYQSQLQQDLVDLSLSNAFLIAKLDSINIKAKTNSAMLIDIPTSQQSAMIYFNYESSQFIVKYIYLLDSEGVQAAQNHSSQLIANSVSEDSSKNPGHGPNQRESNCASLLAV